MILGRRVTLERIITLVRSGRPEPEIRADLHRELERQRREAAQEMAYIAGALAAVIGDGPVDLPPDVLAALPADAGLQFEMRSDGHIVVTPVQISADIRQIVLAANALLTVPEDAAVAPAAANLEESEAEARVRICNAVRLLIRRHYDAECRARGALFVESVFGELLAMAFGIELAETSEPEPIKERVQQFAERLVPRVLHYLLVASAERDRRQSSETEPGEPSAPAGRVM